MEKVRPRSVSIIAWINIVLGIAGIYNVIQMPRILSLPKYQQVAEAAKASLHLSMIISSIFSFVFLVSGIAMLRGLNWGRFLYLIGIGIIVVFNTVSSKFSPLSLPGLAIYVTFFIFLTQPAAVEFFKKENSGI